MRRDFSITEEDETCLKAQGFEWNTILEGSARWLIIRNYPIRDGYNVAVADIALRLQPSYPDVEIDMAYFYPALSSKCGRLIKALTPIVLEGKQYQQWSRHRTAANPWRPGIDNVCTHLLQVDSWLDREIPRVAA